MSPDTATPGCTSVSGVSVHVGVGIPAHDRMRFVRLCRYTGRPPVATERLLLRDSGCQVQLQNAPAGKKHSLEKRQTAAISSLSVVTGEVHPI